MRNITLITILIVGLMTSYSLAQMGHGMMRDSHMMGEHGTAGSGQMMEHGQMMGNVKEMTQDMSNMIRQLAGVMSRDMPGERRYKISEMMRDIAAEMNRISFMLDRGNVTEEEMKDLENRMIEIQKHMPDIIK